MTGIPRTRGLELLGFHHRAELLEVEDARDRRQLAARDDPASGRVGVDPVRRLRYRQEVEHAGHLRRIDHRHAAHGGRLAILDGLFGRPPVDDRRVVAIEAGGVGFQRGRGHLRVVGGPERPSGARALSRRAEIPVERWRQDLPADRQRAGGRIDLQAADHAVELALVLGRLGVAALGQRHREAGRDQHVLAVLGHERRAVVAARVRDRPEDLLGLEVAQVDPGDAVVGVVVDEQPAAVVLTVGLREPGVVDVTPGEVAEHLPRLLVVTVAGPGVLREHRDGGNVPHRRQAGHVDLPRVPAGVEQVVLVFLAWLDVGLGRGGGRRRGRRAGAGRAAGRGDDGGGQQQAGQELVT